MSHLSDITLIIPFHNEARRLDSTTDGLMTYFRTSESRPHMIFVNDGSADDTRTRLEALCEKLRNCVPESTFNMVSYDKAGGKGWALFQGILACKTAWCLTLDADLSAGPRELDFWQERGWLHMDQDRVFIGSREMGIREGLATSSALRRPVSVVFNRLVQRWTGLHLDDTQCGFKLYPSAIAKEIFTNLSDYGFAHDVEVLLRLRNMNVPVAPLAVHWQPEKGSKVNVFSDGWQMLKVIRTLGKRYTQHP
ncbi:MAG: glycosyltransferase [Flavobacteriales bacterium]|nr:glycosyltransferase [Flavobacteriales bacterium]MCB9449549.1 glycosyltransferase [Flavobacteriales bacterium]